MRDERKWRLAFAEFEAMHAHVPSHVSEKFVSDYHAVLDKMADASEEDLDSFRIPATELKPRVVSVQLGGLRSPGKAHYSKDNYCDTNLFKRKIDALASYLPNIEERMRRPITTDDSKDYWSMSTPQLERLATKFGIGGYGDQHGHVERDVIIKGLLKRDSALQSPPLQANRSADYGTVPNTNLRQTSRRTSPNMNPEDAATILRQLISDAARLKSESFGSPKRDEWAETAQAALRQAFGDGGSILKSFGRAQSIMFKAGDTEENLRKAANDTLASEEAVLLSAITQLGWQTPSDDPAVEASRAAGEEPGFRAWDEGPVRSIKSTFNVGDANFLIVDGEVWRDTEVEEEEHLIVGHFHGGSVARVAQLSFEDLKGYFDRIEISDPTAKKDLFDWEFAYLEVDLFTATEDRVDVVFRIEYDLEFWARDYSIADLAIATEKAVTKHSSRFTYWQRSGNTAIEGFGVSSSMSLKDFVSDALEMRKYLAEVPQVIRTELNEQESRAIRLVFDFPPTIKNACEQYLMYFVQFLSDMGIDAKAEVKERARSVLFSVTPEDDKQALERIWEALQVYLGLPAISGLALAAHGFQDVAISQLQANILHLQSQVMLSKAAIEMQNSTIEAKDARIALLQERIDLRTFQPVNHPKVEEEELVKGLVSVKKWDYKFLELNLPEILRRLKRRFR
jgi:hypothetical protein